MEAVKAIDLPKMLSFWGLFALQSPFWQGKRKDAIRLMSDSRFVDLHANLNHFRGRYDEILKARYEGFDGLDSVRGTPYRRVQRLHYEYLQRQRAEVEGMLGKLATFEIPSEAVRAD